MDIELFDYETKAEAGFWVDLLHPVTVQPTGIRFNVVGMDSKTYESAASDFNRELSQIEADTKLSKEQKEEAKLEASCKLWTRCTLGWEGLNENGKEMPFNTKDCHRIYRKYKGAREQIDKAIASRLRLFEKPKEG